MPNAGVKLHIWVPTDLAEALREAAASDDRTLSYEIVRRLKASFPQEESK